MSARLLVLGASGLLGHAVLVEARRRSPEGVHGTYRSLPPALAGTPGMHRLDLADPGAVKDLLDRLRPRTVVNCAGIVKAVCHDPYAAITVNAAAPHLVAASLRPWGGRLVQVSTDCVFSGRRGAYAETDTPDPIDLYGHTKLLGEVGAAPHLTVRTSFIGFELSSDRGLLSWLLGQRGRVQGFRGVLWSGLTADHLARHLLELAGRQDVTGLLHVAGETVDKDALLRLLAEVFGRTDLTIEAADEPRVDRSLDSGRLRRLGVVVASMAEMARDLRDWGVEQGL